MKERAQDARRGKKLLIYVIYDDGHFGHVVKDSI